MKNFLWAIGKYIFVTGVLLLPVFLVLLGFDFIFDLEVGFFDEISFPRFVFFIWFLFVNFAYIWVEWGDKIKEKL